jgi:D-inositol-3-phosphate glycosyltransferase
MRIAMLSFHTCPLATLGGKDTGGMNVYVRELTRHLGKAGLHVDVFTRSQDEHVPHVLHDLGYGNRVVHIPAGPEVPLPKQELAHYIPDFSREILKFAAEKGLRYDILHSHYWMSGLSALTLQKEWDVPVINMFHTLALMKNRIARSESEMEGDYRIEGEKTVIRSANRLVAATLAEKAQLEFLYQAEAAKIFVIPPGVDLARFYPIPKDEAKAVIGIPPEDRMILFVGRIEPLKGLETLLRALAHLRKMDIENCCPVYLVVIGGEPDASPETMNAEMARLFTLRDELNLKDMVIFLGKRDQDTLSYYYSAAEVVVVPSFYESFGMVALEAMACGTPVVASQVGGLAFLVQDGITGYVVPDGDDEALFNRLYQLAQNPELRSKLGEQAAASARSYGWDIITTQMIRLYDETLLHPRLNQTSQHSGSV